MKSKRDLKKQIRYICGDLVGECMLISEICPAEKDEAISKLIVKLAVLQESTLKKVNFSFDKSPRDFENLHEYHKARKAYNREAYTALHNQFNEQLKEIVHEMNDIAGLAKEA